MGIELFGACPAFDKSIAAAEAHFRLLGADWCLKAELLKPETTSNVNKSHLSQALSTSIQIGLVDLFNTWGIRPNVVVGHSSGEIAAAYAAGALSFEDAISATYHRGRLMGRVDQILQGAQGAMLAVGLPADEAIAYINTLPCEKGQVCVACINSPSSVTVSGDRPQILALREDLEAKAIFNRLVVDKAYHSHHMGAIYDEYIQALNGITTKSFRGSARMVSTVLGDDVDGQDVDATYWARNLISPVRFSEAIGKVCSQQLANEEASKSSSGIILEIGPHSSLAGPIQQVQRALRSNMKYESALIRNVDASKSVFEMARSLCSQGITVGLSIINMLNNPKVLGDYPPYAWDTAIYWHESHLSKPFLQRKYPRHSLLGVLSSDNNPLEPKWRNYIKVADIPWVTGHAFQGKVVYPASGFICMALEAMRQQARSRGDADKNVLYNLRDVNVTRALLIPDDSQGVETIFSLRPHRQTARNSSATWNEFRIFSVSGSGDWGEHCRGLISIQPHVTNDEVEGNRENEVLGNNARKKFAAARNSCKVDLAPSKLYDILDSISSSYTGLFRSLTSVSTTAFESLCTFNIPDVQRTMPGAFDQPHCLHPVTLDLCFQAMMPALHSVGMLDAPTGVNYVEELTVVSEIDSNPGAEYVTNLVATKIAKNKYKADVNVREASEHARPLNIIGKRLVYTSLSMGSDRADETSIHDRRLCHRIDWVPDIASAEPQTVRELCGSVVSDESGLNILSCLEGRARHIMRTTLAAITAEDEENMLPYKKLHLRWMRNVARDTGEEVATGPVDKLGADGEILGRIGSNLVDILKGKVHPLTIMIEGDLLYRCYSNKSVTRCITQVSAYVRMLCQQNPTMRILEIGAGTGSATVPLLRAISSRGDQLGDPLLAQYTFTDISAGFFEKAKDLLRPWVEAIDFQKLDIEQPIDGQGFENGSFDLVVACNCLHATKVMSNTMRNVRKLLKPHGKLCLIEVTQPSLVGGLVFGTLPGWWLGAAEDGRVDSPLLSIEQWAATLSENGFSGVDHWFPDYPIEQGQQYSAIISTAVGESHRFQVTQIEIICTESKENPSVSKLPSFLISIVRHYYSHGLSRGHTPLGTCTFTDTELAKDLMLTFYSLMVSKLPSYVRFRSD